MYSSSKSTTIKTRMYSIMIERYFVFSLVLAAAAASECVTPNGETGKCVSIYECPALLETIATSGSDPNKVKFARNSMCGYTTVPLVCCGSSSADYHNQIRVQDRTAKRKLFPPKRNCGRQRYDDYFHKTSPTGGSSAIDEFPWLVSLRYYSAQDGEDQGFRCAGTLISDRYVLTTAHCLRMNGYQLDSVRLGEYNIKNKEDCIIDGQFDECTDPVIDLGYDDLIVHPGFNFAEQKHDIGLIRLNETVSFSDYVRPICLPFSDLKLAKPGDRLVSSGWRKLSNDVGLAEIKKKVSVKLISNEECGLIYRLYRLFVNDDGLTCTIQAPNVDAVACHDDSGGPVMYTRKNQWYIEGVAAYKENCGNLFPTMNINVRHYINWILDNVRE